MGDLLRFLCPTEEPVDVLVKFYISIIVRAIKGFHKEEMSWFMQCAVHVSETVVLPNLFTGFRNCDLYFQEWQVQLVIVLRPFNFSQRMVFWLSWHVRCVYTKGLDLMLQTVNKQSEALIREIAWSNLSVMLTRVCLILRKCRSGFFLSFFLFKSCWKVWIWANGSFT